MSMNRRWFLPLLFSLSGCTVGTDYIRPAVDSPDTWRIDYAAAAGVANMEWCKQFHDPVLDELITIALRENKDLRIAAARAVESAARVDSTRSVFYPRLGHSAEASSNGASREAIGGVAASGRSHNNYTASANLSRKLDLWGRIRHATEAVGRQPLGAYLHLVKTAFREVNDALVNVQNSREQLLAECRRVKALADYARLAGAPWRGLCPLLCLLY
jgi:multidrug efflux system outer membrane protein